MHHQMLEPLYLVIISIPDTEIPTLISAVTYMYVHMMAGLAKTYPLD